MATPTVRIDVKGARGESEADILRRTGAFGVLPSDDDLTAELKKNAVAIAAKEGAELARDQAADLVLPANIFVGADLATARSDGEAGTVDGTYFKAVGAAEGEAEVRLRTSGGSDLLYTEVTKAALASTASGKGAFLFKYEDGDTGQDFQQRFALPTGVNTAAELEAFLTANQGRAIFKPGTSYTVETAPFPTEDNLFIDGQGATLTNTNATPIGTNDLVNQTLFLGTDAINFMAHLTAYEVQSITREKLTLDTGDGANFAVGDLVWVHGDTFYTAPAGTIYRNQLRARVTDVTGDVVTLDRPLPKALQDDTTVVIANLAEGITYPHPSIPELYFLYRPTIQNLKLASTALSNWGGFGGVIDGVWRNIVVDARNGFVFNGLQNCTVEGIRFQARRKLVELAHGSAGTTVSNIKGAIIGDGTDATVYVAAISENSHDCTIKDFDLDSGPAAVTGGNAVLLASGTNNRFRDGTFRLPSLSNTTTALGITSRSEAGNSTDDCGYENLEVYCGTPSGFFTISDTGAGINRAYFRNITFRGTPANRAGAIVGAVNEAQIENVNCESGAMRLSSTMTNCRIANNYFPGGFSNLTLAILQSNDIRDNQSDASHRIMAAAKVAAAQTSVTETTANTAFSAATMTIAAGDLTNGDAVHLCLAGTKSGTNNSHIRVTCQTDGSTPFELAHIQTTTSGDAWEIAGIIEVQSNIAVYWRGQQITSAGATGLGVRNTGGNLTNNGLVVTVEIWTETSGSVEVQSYAIAGQKLGMRNVRVFA